MLPDTTAPAPPLAITGTVTAARTARSMAKSNPALVPSASIELSKISPTPSPAPRAAQALQVLDAIGDREGAAEVARIMTG